MDELIETLESALANAYKRHIGATGEAHVRIDSSRNDIKVYCQREVVGMVTNDYLQIGIEEARKTSPGIEIGDFVETEVAPEVLGRIAAQTAKQVVLQKLRETERKRTFDEFHDRVGEVVSGVVQRTENRVVYVALNKVEAVLPPREQVPIEPYRFNDRLKVYVLRVDEGSKGPMVVVSRSHPGLLRRLFELEVPEIEDGTVVIKAVAREPGQRSKIAVMSTDERVDPIGACVGHRGARVQAVVNELYDEKIDIIRWTENPQQFIADALSPAKVSSVLIDEPSRSAFVVVPDSQLSLAIGKGGQNVRLAARLTEWKIDIRSDSQVARGEGPSFGPPLEDNVAAEQGTEPQAEPVVKTDAEPAPEPEPVAETAEQPAEEKVEG